MFPISRKAVGIIRIGPSAVVLIVLLLVLSIGSLTLDRSVTGDIEARANCGSSSSTSTSTELAWIRDHRDYQLNADYISDIAWNPNYSLVAVATCRGELGIIDPDVWPSYRSIDFGDAYVYSVDWAPNGSHLAVASVDGSVVILDTSDWTVHRTIEFLTIERRTCLAYSPRGDLLAIGHGVDVIVYRTANWSRYMTRSLDREDELWFIAWSPNGKYISTKGDWGNYVLDTEYLETIWCGWGAHHEDTGWSPNGTHYFAAAGTGIVNIIQASPWDVVMTLYPHNPKGEAKDADWDSTGDYFITCRTNGWIDVWTTSDWNRIFRAFPEEKYVTQVGWGKDLSLFVTGDGEGNVIFYRLSPGNFIDLAGDEVLYANYTAYQFIVDPNPLEGNVMPTSVALTLDPSGANVTIGCGLEEGDEGTRVVQDPDGYISLFSTPYDVVWDPTNNTADVIFRIMFNWTWPHEDSCDAMITTYHHGFVQFNVTAEDLFRVENDVTFRGPLRASGEWQGELSENDWVRAGEEVTLYGPVLTYQGTDVYHPIIPLDLLVTDDDGSLNTSALESGEPARVSITTDGTTDANESLRLGLANLPEGATLVSEPTFRLRVDGDAPGFSNILPEETNWQSVDRILASVTVADGNTSGVYVGSLEFSYSTHGTVGFTTWSRSEIAIAVAESSVEGLVTVTLLDGDDNRLRWRVLDLVGNEAISDPLTVRVDTKNVTFSDPVPEDNGWLNALEVLCGVTISDLEGSGIDVSTIQFRVSPRNLSQYGGWTDWDEGGEEDARVIVTSTDVLFSLSTFNYVQWRAMDIAGNGFTVSPHYRVRVDVEPIEFTTFGPGPEEIIAMWSVQCTAGVRDNPGGGGVDMTSIGYRWSTGEGWSRWKNATMTGAVQETVFQIVVELADGFANLVQLRGSDVAGNGPTLSPVHSISVDASPPVFEGLSPDPKEKQEGPLVHVSIRIRDDLTRVHGESIQYRTGTGGSHGLGAWSTPEVAVFDDDCLAVVELDLLPGRNNTIQFMASDIIGNDAASDQYVVWMNEPPLAMIASPKSSVTYDDGTEVILDATGSGDPDSADLEFLWYMDNGTDPVGTNMSLALLFDSGTVNLTLVVIDEMGATDEAKVTITVEHLEEPEVQEMDPRVALWVVLALVLVLVAALILRWRAVERAR